MADVIQGPSREEITLGQLRSKTYLTNLKRFVRSPGGTKQTGYDRRSKPYFTVFILTPI